MPRQRPDPQLVTVLLDVVELLDPVDVHERSGLRQAKPHERNQAVAAGKHLGVLAKLAEQLRRLVTEEARAYSNAAGITGVPPSSSSRACPGSRACRRA